MTIEEFISGEAFSYGDQFIGYVFKQKTANSGEIITVIDGKKYCDVVAICPTVAMITAPLFGHAALRYNNLKCWKSEINTAHTQQLEKA